MTVIEITQHHHVILLALQRQLEEGKGEKSLTFSKLWRAVDAGASSIMPHIHNKADLVRELLWATEILDEGMIVTRQVRAGKLISITLTDFGEQHLRSTIFSHQDRAPDIEDDIFRKARFE